MAAEYLPYQLLSRRKRDRLYTTLLNAFYVADYVDRDKWPAEKFKSRVLEPALFPAEQFRSSRTEDNVVHIHEARPVPLERFREVLSMGLNELVAIADLDALEKRNCEIALGWAEPRAPEPDQLAGIYELIPPPIEVNDAAEASPAVIVELSAYTARRHSA